MGTNTPNPSGGTVLPFPGRRAQRRHAQEAAGLSLLDLLRDAEQRFRERNRRHEAARRSAVVTFPTSGTPAR